VHCIAYYRCVVYTDPVHCRTYTHVAHANADNKRTYRAIFQRTARIAIHVIVHPYDDVIMIRYKLTNYIRKETKTRSRRISKVLLQTNVT